MGRVSGSLCAASGSDAGVGLDEQRRPGWKSETTQEEEDLSFALVLPGGLVLRALQL